MMSPEPILYVLKGGNACLPAAGEVGIIVDSSGTMFLLASDGTRTQVGAGSATTRTATASNSTSVSIDVSADGDGEFLFGFDGVISNSPQKLQIQFNGGTGLVACQGNTILWNAAGTVNAATTETAGTAANIAANGTNMHASIKGRVSFSSGAQSSLTSQYVVYNDANNTSGVAAVIHTPNAALTSIQLTTTVANGMTSGKFWVRKVA